MRSFPAKSKYGNLALIVTDQNHVRVTNADNENLGINGVALYGSTHVVRTADGGWAILKEANGWRTYTYLTRRDTYKDASESQRRKFEAEAVRQVELLETEYPEVFAEVEVKHREEELRRAREETEKARAALQKARVALQKAELAELQAGQALLEAQTKVAAR